MSLQLIYTSAPQLLSQGMSGYGTVARSAGFNKGLIRKLEGYSTYAENHAIKGPQYAYRILDCAGKTYHLLSCTQAAGADYSGRDCHISHHLILNKEEVAKLHKDSYRPTPAGIILALISEQFWVKQWAKEPRADLEEVQLYHKSNLPDASIQTYWKMMTGHKINARAFSTPPFEHDCLSIVPRSSDSCGILHLLHESDWLDRSHGWGKTFTTQGTPRDRFADTQRIFIAKGSDLEARALRTGRPILRVSPDFVLPSVETAKDNTISKARIEARKSTHVQTVPPPNVPSVPGNTATPIQAPLIASGGNIQAPSNFPYYYKENSDSDIYPQTDKNKRNLTWLMSLVFAGLSTAATFLVIMPLETDLDSVTTIAPPKQQSLAFTKAPQNQGLIRDAQSKTINRHQNKGSRSQQDSDLAQAPYEKAAQNFSNISQSNLPSIYLLHHAIAGNSLPKAMEQLLQQAPLLIENGFIRAGNLEGDSVVLPLNRNSYSILIEALPKGLYLITPVQDGIKKPNHRMLLQWDGEKYRFTLNNKEGYLFLEAEDAHTDKSNKLNILLLPRITKTFNIASKGLSELGTRSQIDLSPADIQVERNNKSAQFASLTLQPKSKSLFEKPSKATRLSLNIPLNGDPVLSIPFLPEVADQNIICDTLTGSATQKGFSWSATDFSADNDLAQNFKLNVKQVLKDQAAIEDSFIRIANNCCAGSTKGQRFYSLGTLYTIIHQLETELSPSKRKALMQQYYKLFEHQEFSQLLIKELDNYSDMALQPSQLQRSQADDLLAIKYIEAQLRRPQVCKGLKEQICRIIAKRISRESHLRRDKPKEERLQLELQDIGLNEGGLHWYFKLIAP